MEEVLKRYCSSDEQHEAKTGWLKKLGTNGRMFAWSDRWCEERKGALCFWESQEQCDSGMPAKSTIEFFEVPHVTVRADAD